MFTFNIFERTNNGVVYKDKVVENNLNEAYYKVQRYISNMYRNAGVTPKYPDRTPKFFAVPEETCQGV